MREAKKLLQKPLFEAFARIAYIRYVLSHSRKKCSKTSVSRPLCDSSVFARRIASDSRERFTFTQHFDIFCLPPSAVAATCLQKVFVAPSMSLVVSVCVHPTWPRSSSHPRAGQRSATVPSQWPHQGPGTVCLRQSGPRRPYRRFVVNWRHSSSALVTTDIIIKLFHLAPFYDHQHTFCWLCKVPLQRSRIVSL